MRVSDFKKRVLSEITCSPFSFTLVATFALAESETTFLATGDKGVGGSLSLRVRGASFYFAWWSRRALSTKRNT